MSSDKCRSSKVFVVFKIGNSSVPKNEIKWYRLSLAPTLGPPSQTGLEFVIQHQAVSLQLIQRHRLQPWKELKGHSNRGKRDDLHTTPPCVSQRCPPSGVTTLHRLLLISTFTVMSRSPVPHCTETVPLWWTGGHSFTSLPTDGQPSDPSGGFGF